MQLFNFVWEMFEDTKGVYIIYNGTVQTFLSSKISLFVCTDKTVVYHIILWKFNYLDGISTSCVIFLFSASGHIISKFSWYFHDVLVAEQIRCVIHVIIIHCRSQFKGYYWTCWISLTRVPRIKTPITFGILKEIMLLYLFFFVLIVIRTERL